MLADGRFAWGQAALEDGDCHAAVDLFTQALERAPGWAAAWFALGDAQERLGNGAAAIAAFRAARFHDRDGHLGAALRLATLGSAPPPAHPGEAYVRTLFDQYAPNFEQHLTQGLQYRGPQLMLEAVSALDRDEAALFTHAIDLGCGTGLAAQMFASRVTTFTGVDLSPEMIARAKRTGLYQRLAADDVVAFLQAEPDASADLILAADVLVYLGDLAPLMREMARVLSPGGLLPFTVLSDERDGWHLGADLCYRHAASYMRQLADDHGLAVSCLEQAWARKHNGHGLPGLVGVLAKP